VLKVAYLKTCSRPWALVLLHLTCLHVHDIDELRGREFSVPRLHNLQSRVVHAELYENLCRGLYSIYIHD